MKDCPIDDGKTDKDAGLGLRAAYKYFRMERVLVDRKTLVFDVVKNDDFCLGRITWNPAWRCYWFVTLEGSSIGLTKGCMADLNDFISQLEDLRKKGGAE